MRSNSVSRKFHPATVLITLAAVVLLFGGRPVCGESYLPGYPDGSTSHSSSPTGSSGGEVISTEAGVCWSNCWAASQKTVSKAGTGTVEASAWYEGYADCNVTYTWSGAPGTGPGGYFETGFGGSGGATAEGYYVQTPSPARTSPPSPTPWGWYNSNAYSEGYAYDEDDGSDYDNALAAQNSSDFYSLSGSNEGTFSGDTFTVYAYSHCSTGAGVYISGANGWYAVAHAHGTSSSYTETSCVITLD